MIEWPSVENRIERILKNRFHPRELIHIGYAFMGDVIDADETATDNRQEHHH